MICTGNLLSALARIINKVGTTTYPNPYDGIRQRVGHYNLISTQLACELQWSGIAFVRPHPFPRSY
jgi:hypothetical protein